MRDFMKEEIGYMDYGIYKDIFKKNIEHLPYSIKLNWRGEPLLHPKIADMVAFAKDIGVHEVQLNTNGLLLTKELAIDLAEAGLDRIIISMDGFTKETYEKIRRGGDFYQLCDNLLTTYQTYKAEK